jgi:hypothetical protein
VLKLLFVQVPNLGLLVKGVLKVLHDYFCGILEDDKAVNRLHSESDVPMGPVVYQLY